MKENKLKKGYVRTYHESKDNIEDAVSDVAKPGAKAGNPLIDQNLDYKKNKKFVNFIGSSIRRLKIQIEKDAIPEIRKNIDHIVRNNIKTRPEIEFNLDSLLNYIPLGLGEKEFEKLKEYYSKIYPRNAKQYERFYKDAKEMQ